MIPIYLLGPCSPAWIPVINILSTPTTKSISQIFPEFRLYIEAAPAAAMVLILIDAETGMIIGISTAEGEAKDLLLEDRKKRLEYTIKKMFNEL